jgi:hypothetical protein
MTDLLRDDSVHFPDVVKIQAFMQGTADAVRPK